MSYKLHRVCTPIPDPSNEQVEHFLLRPRCNSMPIELGQLSPKSIEYFHLPKINEDNKSIISVRTTSESSDHGVLLTNSMDRAAFQQLRLGGPVSERRELNRNGAVKHVDNVLLQKLQDVALNDKTEKFRSRSRSLDKLQGPVHGLKGIRTAVEMTSSPDLTNETSWIIGSPCDDVRPPDLPIEHRRTRSTPVYEYETSLDEAQRQSFCNHRMRSAPMYETSDDEAWQKQISQFHEHRVRAAPVYETSDEAYQSQPGQYFDRRTRSFPVYETSSRPRKLDKRAQLQHSQSAPDAARLLQGWCYDEKSDTLIRTRKKSHEHPPNTVTHQALQQHLEQEEQKYDELQSKKFIMQKWQDSQEEI